MLGLTAPSTTLAATAPDLGTAAGYSVFGKAGVTNVSGTTHVWGNVGADSSVTGLIASQVSGTINTPAAGVEAAILSAYGSLAAQSADAALDLAGTNTVAPGVYTVGATTLNGTLTLNGAGVYIFRSSSSIPVSSGAQVLLTNGADACNVFWQVPASMTIGTNAVMVGTIIANTELISLGAGATLQGRALSRIAQVTLDNNQITEPTCTTGGSSGPRSGNLNVVKTVINNNGGTKTAADFQLFVNGTPVSSGVTNTFSAPAAAFTITETNDPNYTRTFSGDCDINGQLNLNPGDYRLCIVTNDDIGTPAPLVPPLIEVVKVASPLSLPGGAGPVTYTYTIRNIGTVPMTNVTMVGDTCAPIVLISGDLNLDAKLDLNETWVHRCTTALSATHTNTVVATGWANGISAVDIASATVVVGAPIVPPLIHVVKVPSVFLLPAPGGAVTYSYTVTNPGSEPLSNVSITDDKCTGLPGRVVGHPGDINKNNLLESTESWSFTCQTNLTQTTINTGTAVGSANGLTARDFAVATVVVGVPGLPNTGIAPDNDPVLWNMVLLAGIFGIATASQRKQVIR